MVETAALYDTLQEQNIQFEYFSMNGIMSLSLVDEDGDCYIGMDASQVLDGADERVKLAHETGHCVTGAFYNRYSKLCCIGQQEHRADAWAVKKLLPWEELNAALQNGVVEVWQLAEWFAVTEDFVCRALSIYSEDGRYHAP